MRTQSGSLGSRHGHPASGYSEIVRRQIELLCQSHDAVIATDPHRVILAWNKAAEDLYGWSEAETLGKFTHELLHTRSPIPHAELYEILLREGLWEGELTYTARDGRRVVAKSRQVLLRSEDGEAAGIAKINRVAALRQTASPDGVGALAASLAHHFNNLLAIIVGNASLALEDCPACESMRSILTATERASDLTRQLLAYAGKVPVATASVDLRDLLSRSAETVRRLLPETVRLDFALHQELPSIRGDAGQIRQILSALLANAAEATAHRGDGTITVAASACHRAPSGSYVCLEVRDNGCGMDETARTRIFDPFFTTKGLGRGLGLACVQGMVRAHDGFIEVDSAPGAGSTFRVFLPAEGKGQPNRPALLALPATPGPATILVVDDEEVLRKMLATLLKRQGYQVLQAANGQEALDLLFNAGVRPSLMVLDMIMPVMGGHDLLPILEMRCPELKVIVASGYTGQDTGKHPPSKLIAGFLNKPFTGDRLIETIQRALGRAHTPEPAPQR